MQSLRPEDLLRNDKPFNTEYRGRRSILACKRRHSRSTNPVIMARLMFSARLIDFDRHVILFDEFEGFPLD